MKSHEPKKWGQNKGKNRRMKRKKGKNIDKKIVKDKKPKIKVLTHELLASTLLSSASDFNFEAHSLGSSQLLYPQLCLIFFRELKSNRRRK
jgi:hypothetical protein